MQIRMMDTGTKKQQIPEFSTKATNYLRAFLSWIPCLRSTCFLWRIRIILSSSLTPPPWPMLSCWGHSAGLFGNRLPGSISCTRETQSEVNHADADPNNSDQLVMVYSISDVSRSELSQCGRVWQLIILFHTGNRQAGQDDVCNDYLNTPTCSNPGEHNKCGSTRRVSLRAGRWRATQNEALNTSFVLSRSVLLSGKTRHLGKHRASASQPQSLLMTLAHLPQVYCLRSPRASLALVGQLFLLLPVDSETLYKVLRVPGLQISTPPPKSLLSWCNQKTREHWQRENTVYPQHGPLYLNV